ncbi:acyl-CoA/acyl-ACP dehydrogenase [Streptomyces sp. 71268]|uniref:acyl-CoA dehydrogenase family protein n=1 Tax=Streptomyces sp. 71268 TaxID=3002640 RepID=UPI0023F6946E|nr:acyl-CoA dehydrogenase family protein [Streptomyces sp. 71268]WEV29428.1 acyl-CoA/acyl-ACP dehydrogenase [Streptomyces sp. 71268]
MTHTDPAPTPLRPAAPSNAPDLLYREHEEDLRSAVRALLADRLPTGAVLAHIDAGRAYDAGLWRVLATDLGLAGLLVPDALGGQGAGAREAAVVLEELGRAVAPVPYLTSAVIATEALLACAGVSNGAASHGSAAVPGPPADAAPPTVTQPAGRAEEADAVVATELLAALATGERIGVLAVPLSTAPGTAHPTAVRADTAAVRADARATLTGEVTSVADALAAAVLLVPARGPAGAGLYAVDTGAAISPGLRLEPTTALDPTRPLARVGLDGAPARRVAGPVAAGAAIDRALRAGAGLLASEQLGLAEWCLAETVRHTGERHQFGRPVGSFQALKHRMARIWLDLVSTRAAARAAADALAAGAPDTPVAVAVAQAHAARVAVHAAQECVQLHGGIGMTWEHPAHLYLKRAKSDEIALGTPGRHQEALADLVDLPAPPA